MGWFDRPKKVKNSSGTKATESDVRHAYRLLLKRDPDPDGLAHFLQRVRDGLTLDALICEFVRSDEYLVRLENERFEDEKAVDLGGYHLLVPTRDPDFGGNIYAFGQYEEPVRQAVRAHLQEGDVFIDVGANVGVMTFLAVSIVGPSGRVIAVEPNPANVQLLYRSMVLNDSTNVEIVPLAASNRRAVFSLSGRSNTHLVDARSIRAGGNYVQSVALDDLLGEMPRLDFVKMDIEGHEPAAFEGMLHLVTRHRPTLLTEFNPRCLAVQQHEPLGY